MFGGSCVGPPVGAEGEIQTELRDCVNNTCPGNTFCSENISQIIICRDIHIIYIHRFI